MKVVNSKYTKLVSECHRTVTISVSKQNYTASVVCWWAVNTGYINLYVAGD